MIKKTVSPYKCARMRQLQPQLVYYYVRKGAPHVMVNGRIRVDPEAMDKWFVFVSELKTLNVVYRAQHHHDGTCIVHDGEEAGTKLKLPPAARVSVTLEDFQTVQAKTARKRTVRHKRKEASNETEENTPAGDA